MNLTIDRGRVYIFWTERTVAKRCNRITGTTERKHQKCYMPLSLS